MSNQSNLSVEERKALKEQTALSNEGEKQTKIQISLRSYVDVDQINNAIVMSGMKVVTAHFYIKSTESVFHRDYEPGVSQVLDAQAAVQEYADSLDFVPIISKQVRNAAEDVQVWALVVEAPANILLEWWLSHAHIVRHARILREGAMHDMIRPDAPYPFIE